MTWIRLWRRRLAYLLRLLLQPSLIDALLGTPPPVRSVAIPSEAPQRYTAVLMDGAGVSSVTQRCLPVPELIRRYHGKQTAVYAKEAQDAEGRWVFRLVTH